MELKYEKYNKVNYKLNNTIRLFANVFIKKGNKNTSENILHTLLQEFKKKRFQEEKLNQTSHITLRETIEEKYETFMTGEDPNVFITVGHDEEKIKKFSARGDDDLLHSAIWTNSFPKDPQTDVSN